MKQETTTKISKVAIALSLVTLGAFASNANARQDIMVETNNGQITSVYCNARGTCKNIAPSQEFSTEETQIFLEEGDINIDEMDGDMDVQYGGYYTPHSRNRRHIPQGWMD